jgi:ribosomal protein S18 acetylase RimI-like enzyme
MDIEYAYTWKDDYLPLIDDLITSAETQSEFAEWWKLRKKSIIKGKIEIIVALIEGVPSGFLTYSVEDNLGKMEACHVLDAPGKQEIAVSLVTRGIELLTQETLVDISGELYYIAGPIEPLVTCLLEAGASVYIRVGMARDLDSAPPTPVLPEGYTVYEWTLKDIPVLAAFFCEAFKDSIDLVFWEHFRQREKAITYIENVATSSVWSRVPMTNMYVTRNGTVCAASLCGSPEKGKGGIMLGVKKEHRGKGLGRFLLTQPLTAYYKAQFNTVGLEVTLQNKLAYSFFKRYGFRDVYRLIGYTFSPESKIEF